MKGGAAPWASAHHAPHAGCVASARLLPLLLLLCIAGPLTTPGAARAQPGAPEPTLPAPPLPSAPDEGAPADVPSPADSPSDLSDLIEGVDRLLQDSRRAADEALSRKDYPAALAALERAHELSPGELETTVQLANLLSLLGNLERAEGLYRQVIEQDARNAAAHVALADLLVRSGEDTALPDAALLLARARELQGNRPELLLRQARVEAHRGRFEQAERAYQGYGQVSALDDAMRLELGDFYRDFGRPDEALRHYRAVAGQDAASAAAQRIFALEVEREARRYGFAPGRRTPPARVKELIARARTLSAEGAHRNARELLQEAIALSPTHAPAHAALGEVLATAGERADAELAYLRALAFDPSPEIERALAELYLAAPGGRQAAHAAAMLERVLSRRPDWVELHLTLARALRDSGEPARALLHARRAIAHAPPGAERRRAEALAQELQRLLGEGGTALAQAAEPASGREPAVLAEARAHLARGRVEAALAALQRGGGGDAEAELLRARILHGAGRVREAAAVLRALLARDRHHAEAHLLLGRVLLSGGDRKQRAAGRAALIEAERLGEVDASLELARLDARPDPGPLSWLTDAQRVLPLVHARDRLARIVETGGAGAGRDDARALLQRVEQRLWALSAAALAVLLLLLLGWLWLRDRLWGGGELRDLIEQAPEAGPELMTILSALRHEVLKHNTMMLTGLCEALARGDDLPRAADQAMHLQRALLGPGGAADRLDGYVEQLEHLGRAHGVRLNLPRNDAAIGALLDGFAALAAVERPLSKVAALSPRRRRRLLTRLGEASELLNARGGAELRELLDCVRTLEVDAELLSELHARIAAEPALAGRAPGPLLLDPRSELPCRVRVPRQIFEDVLGNLMRNALQAMAKAHADAGADADAERGPGLRLGLHVAAELDPITGVAEVAFRVRDNAPEELSDAQLRRRYIEGGLGLTADLVSRHEGSLEVRTDEPGWAKAVVLRLPGLGAAEPQREQ